MSSAASGEMVSLLPFEGLLVQLSATWSEVHGSHLKGLLPVTVKDQEKLAATCGVSRASFRRWVNGSSRPRLAQLVRLFTALSLDPEEFLSLEGEESTPVRNPFAERLREVQSEYGLSQRVMAARLEVSQHALASWLRGIALPDGELSEQLEPLFGREIREARRERELAATSLEGRTPLGELLVRLRLERRLLPSEVADAAGVYVGSLREWEAGTTVPQLSHLRSLVGVYGVPGTLLAPLVFDGGEGVGAFGRRVRRLREERMLGLTELAHAAGIWPFVLHRYEEEGHFPGQHLERLELLASALGISRDELLGYGENGGRFAAWLSSALERGSVSPPMLSLAIGVPVERISGWLDGSSLPEPELYGVLAGFFRVPYEEVREAVIA